MRRPVLIVAFLASFLAPAAIYGWSFYTQFWRVIIGPRSRPLRNIKFEITPARVARGAYLVRGALNCFRCHSARDWSQPGAPPVVGKEGAGHVYADEGIPWLVAPNITPDLETGAGAWSDDMLSRAIREGISHDGRVLHPQMRYPALFHLSDEDLASVIDCSGCHTKRILGSERSQRRGEAVASREGFTAAYAAALGSAPQDHGVAKTHRPCLASTPCVARGER